jgi:phenylacetic acid degradation protein
MTSCRWSPPSAYLQPSAALIGDVVVGPACYAGPGANLRGDFGRIELHQGANVQDTCVRHSFPNHDVIVEENRHISHGAVLHGYIVRRVALVGMNAVVMDDAEVGALAKVLRTLTDNDVRRKRKGTQVYHQLTRRCLESLLEVPPLPEVPADSPRLALPELRRLTDHR